MCRSSAPAACVPAGTRWSCCSRALPWSGWAPRSCMIHRRAGASCGNWKRNWRPLARTRSPMSSGRPTGAMAEPPAGWPGGPSRQPGTRQYVIRPERRVEGVAVTKPAPVAVALDAPDLETAAGWAALVTPHVSTVKIGLELYLRYGPQVVASIRGGSGVSVFLDLKLHDIPATVAGAARAVARLRPDVLTVHAAGGADVVRAAVEAAPGTMVAAVTVLTSLGDDDLDEIGMAGPVPDAVLRLAVLSVGAGAEGLGCSPREGAA